eukprot:11612060-Alexandrium_andersonii.AAC.1
MATGRLWERSADAGSSQTRKRHPPWTQMWTMRQGCSAGPAASPGHVGAPGAARAQPMWTPACVGLRAGGRPCAARPACLG